MTEEKRTKTLDEKVLIAQEYLNSQPKIPLKDLAKKYAKPLSTIYSWVRKYRENGRDGLKDRRGQRKSEDELTEEEKQERQLKETARLTEKRQ